MDLALVGALLIIAGFWWQFSSRPQVDGAPIVENEPLTPTPLNSAALITPSPDPDVSVTPSEAPPQPVPFQITHTVQAGETLLSIAGRYGVSVDEIRLANNLGGELIRVDDELVIPVPEALADPVNGVGVVPSVFLYRVRPGDSIVAIAVRFGATVDGVLTANGLTNQDFIQPDQVLRVPVDRVPSSVLASAEAVRDLPPVLEEKGLYQAPQLLDPDDGDTIGLSDEPLLRWISVDFLQPNEWYVLRVWPVAGSTELPPAVWTKGTSHRLSSRWAPSSGRSLTYSWQVTVVRILPDQGEGRMIESGSDPSPVRRFVWQ